MPYYNTNTAVGITTPLLFSSSELNDDPNGGAKALNRFESAALREKRVVIVEDEAITQIQLRKICQMAGMEVAAVPALFTEHETHLQRSYRDWKHWRIACSSFLITAYFIRHWRASHAIHRRSYESCPISRIKDMTAMPSMKPTMPVMNGSTLAPSVIATNKRP